MRNRENESIKNGYGNSVMEGKEWINVLMDDERIQYLMLFMHVTCYTVSVIVP